MRKIKNKYLAVNVFILVLAIIFKIILPIVIFILALLYMSEIWDFILKIISDIGNAFRGGAL